MRLVVAIPMYNEEEHIDLQMSNLFEADCFDDIFILDDGSTDGTWDLLNQYKTRYKNIHLIRNDINSIKAHGENRWKTLLDFTVSFNPDWVQIRAADVIYSPQFGQLIRDRLLEINQQGGHFVRTPYLDLWRSNTWYRTDRVYGRASGSHLYVVMFKYNSNNYRWAPEHCKTGWHQGYVFPSSMDGLKSCDMNPPEWNGFKIVALHYGFSTHEKIVNRFKKHLKIADDASKIGRSFRMPGSAQIPPVCEWGSEHLCGYLGFYEFDLKLKQIHPDWSNDYIEEPRPVPKSLYNTILEYDSVRAAEYKALYNKIYGEV